MPHLPRTFIDHVRELRRRLLVSSLFFFAGGTVTYIYQDSILALLHQPFHQTLYYTTPAGAFNLAMKVSVLGGVVLLIPVLTYNLLAFVQPALRKRLTGMELQAVTGLTLVLAAAGGIFAYLVVVPMSLAFFGKFHAANFSSLISANDYINFVINCILAFVIIFQLPILLLMIDRIKRLPPRRLLKYERHVIVGSLVIALILPFTYDPLTQFLIALPIIGLYNLSILLLVVSHLWRKPHKTKPAKSDLHSKAPIVASAPTARPASAPTSRQLAQPLISDITVRPGRVRPRATPSYVAHAHRGSISPAMTTPRAVRPLITDVFIRPMTTGLEPPLPRQP